MKNKNDQLDEIVSKKLNQLQVEYKPQHWGQFEELLEKQETGVPVVEDRRLDEVIFEKMRHLKVGERARHWNLLSARMAEQVDIQEKLVLYKLMEASLLLLLLFIVTQNFPLNPTNSNSIPKNPIVLQTDPNSSTSLQNKTDLVANATTPAKVNNNPAKISKPAKNLKPTIDIAQLRSVEQNAPAAETVLKETQLSEKEFKQPTTTSPSLLKSPLKTTASKTEKPSLKETLAEKNNPLHPALARMELLNSLEQLMLSELEYNGQSGSGYVALVSPIKRRSGWVVSMFGSGDYNKIIMPRSAEGDRVFEKLVRYAPGYSGGITAGRELGRWEIGGGAIYTAKKYQPRAVVHVGGSFFNGGYDGEGLQFIELNMVQLPLYFRYNFVHHNKWRAYASLGFSLQVNLQTNYYFADEDAFGLPQLSTVKDYTPEYKENLPGGWLDGGTLWENGYLSGNVSIGLERYITGRWSIFAQPTYHHTLNYFTEGVGPYKDQVNTMSIFTGVRVRLND